MLEERAFGGTGEDDFSGFASVPKALAAAKDGDDVRTADAIGRTAPSNAFEGAATRSGVANNGNCDAFGKFSAVVPEEGVTGKGNNDGLGNLEGGGGETVAAPDAEGCDKADYLASNNNPTTTAADEAVKLNFSTKLCNISTRLCE